jgi:hypothetical protein
LKTDRLVRKQSANVSAMRTAKFAWDAFMRVLAEMTEATREGASADDSHELFQHAGELLDIMGEEIENEPQGARADMRSGGDDARVPCGVGPGCAASKALTPRFGGVFSWRTPRISTQARFKSLG